MLPFILRQAQDERTLFRRHGTMPRSGGQAPALRDAKEDCACAA